FFYCPGNSRHEVIRMLEKNGGQVKRYEFVTTGLQTWTTS
ncbi:MAG TPA: dehydrogenase, partial [Marinilabiliales bacterium]|nr:dehydrogenase [Marinilabiliales bacterium]